MTDPTPILDLMDGFRRSKTMFAAVKLGIFDGLRPTGCAVERLCDACVALGLLEKRGDQYANTPVADEYLSQSSPRSLSGYIRYSNEALYKLWAHLDDAVITGENYWQVTYGKDTTVSNFMDDSRRKRDFIAGMHGLGMLSSPAVVSSFDLSRFKCLIDLGGATGHLAAAARERYAGMRVILFDVPRVIELVRPFVSPAIEVVAGDFFADPLPAGDLYALGKIVHSQPEERSLALLGRIHAALPRGGAVLLAEATLTEASAAGHHAHMQSLNMLVVNNGKERSAREYADLLHRSGFKNVQAHVTGMPLDAILAEK